jgi:hypothetical protein
MIFHDSGYGFVHPGLPTQRLSPLADWAKSKPTEPGTVQPEFHLALVIRLEGEFKLAAALMLSFNVSGKIAQLVQSFHLHRQRPVLVPRLVIW